MADYSKLCRLCHEYKEQRAFPNSERKGHRSTGQCSICLILKNKIRYAKLREQHKESKEELVAKICNKCQILKPANQYHKWAGGLEGYKNECKTCTADIQRFAYLKKTYSLTRDMYENLYRQKQGICEICQKAKDKLCVDHDHKTGIIRGLLCVSCNGAMGKLGDTIEGLEKAVNYLKNHRDTSNGL